MKQLRALLIIALSVFFISANLVEDKPKVFVIGDSISLHYGTYLKKSLNGFFKYDRKQSSTYSMENLDEPSFKTANGGDSSMVLKYLENLEDNKKFKTDYLLANCGLHDIKINPETEKIQITLSDYKKNLKEIVAVSKRINANLVWITTTPVNDSIHNTGRDSFHRYSSDLNKYNKAALKVMHKHKIPVIDLYTFTEKFGLSVFKDHVHYTKVIREKQADFIAGALTQISNGA